MRVIASTIATILLSGTSALAAPFVVLGDSTVDAGSAQLGAQLAGAQDPTPAELGYFMGRFSNGPNTADIVNLALNGELTTSYIAGGSNFAFGGAAIVTDVNQGVAGLPTAIPDLIEQVDTYLARGAISADTDLFVAFGGNDFLAAARGAVTPGAASDGALEVLTEQLRRLAAAGATNVAVQNVNAAGFALGGDTAVAGAVEDYNAALADALVELSMQTGTRFALVDRDGVFDRILADPLAAGFDPALLGAACIANQAAVPSCDGYLFFDPIHVTNAAQALVADAVLDALQPVPLPGALALFATGVVGVAGAARRRRTA